LGGALGSLGQSLAHVKISGCSTPQGPRYSIPKKCILVGPNSHVIPSRWRTKFTGLFSSNAGEIAIVCNVFSGSGDIRGQSRKWSKIDRNFACFWPPIFWGERPPNFWSGIIKFSQIPTMWQSFRAIGRGSSENAWPKKTSVAEYKPVRNGGSGQPNKDLRIISTSIKLEKSSRAQHHPQWVT